MGQQIFDQVLRVFLNNGKLCLGVKNKIWMTHEWRSSAGHSLKQDQCSCTGGALVTAPVSRLMKGPAVGGRLFYFLSVQCDSV